jgi:hypothetical protein
VKLAGTALSIKDRLFAKKLIAFLACTSTASAEETAAFLDRASIGELLLLKRAAVDAHLGTEDMI